MKRKVHPLTDKTEAELGQVLAEVRRRGYARKPGPQSVPTGKYWSCPASFVTHTGYVFIAVKRGKKGWYFIRCGCGAQSFFPPAPPEDTNASGWQDDTGLSLEEAQARVAQFPGSTLFN